MDKHVDVPRSRGVSPRFRPKHITVLDAEQFELGPSTSDALCTTEYGVASVASNVPWTGFGTFDQDPTGAAIARMAGSGVFVMRNPNDDPWSFEIGTRVSTAGCP